ncbi:hypothetical protein F5Y15DRAFT_375810 [Xylariaceae sp. FL0016]|nr:hypothetical protein F5Y15DRAFT_375810 [Xylariaceae sp. FL0016]
MIVGPAIGASFAQSQHATWRWAFYLALPLLGIALALIMILQPSYRFASEKPLSSHFRQLDWVGNLLHMGTFVLLGTACIFSGPTWPWKSGSTVAVWAMFGILAIAYMTQQFFSIGTTPERRIIPTSLFHSRRTTAIWLCTFGAASAFCVVLYYIPLYLDFAQGKGFLDTAVGLLPFTGVFGLTLFLSSQLLPLVRFYMPLFASSAVLLLIGGGLLQTISTTIPEAKVLGYMVFIGAGAGTVWQLALHLNILMFLEPEEHLDAATLHHMALAGGAAVTLAVAGAVYQNVGFRLLQEAVGTMGFSEQDIRQLLVGRHSYVITGEREATIGEILTKIILRCLSMSLAAGAVCFIAACFLKLEAPEFRRPNKKSGVEAVQQIELNRK